MNPFNTMANFIDYINNKTNIIQTTFFDKHSTFKTINKSKPFHEKRYFRPTCEVSRNKPEPVRF